MSDTLAIDARFHAFLCGPEGGNCAEVRYFEWGYAAIKPLLFHWTMIVGQVGDYVTIADRWCYVDANAAKQGLRDWSGEGDPAGWHRHPDTGRRRPDGDPAREYIEP